MATSQPQPHPGAVSSHNLKTKNLCKKYARIGLIDLSSPTTATDSGEKSSSSRRNIRSGSSNDNVITITIPPISTSSTTAATTITASRSAFSSILKKWVQQHLVVDSGKNEDQNIMDIGSICAIPISSNTDDNDSNEKELYIQQGKWINNDHGSSSSSSSFTTSTLQKKDFCTIVETMGCLVDSVIVLYDAKFEHRHSAIVSLLKGIQRQQRSRKESKSTDDNGGGGNNKNSSKGVDLIFLANSDRALLELDGMKDVLMDDNYGPIGSIYIMPVIATGDDDDDDDIDHDKCEVIDKYVRDIMGKISSIDDNTIVERPVHIGAFHKLVQSVHLKLSGKKNSGNKKVEIEFNTIQVKEEMQVVDEDMVKEDINRGNQLDSNSSCEISNENGNESDNLTSTPSDNDNFVREIKLEDEVKKETIQVEEKQTIEEKTINIDQTGRSQKVIEKEKSQNYQSNTAEDRKALESVLVEKSEEIIQRANALMYELEKEQDEILLEPETKMPILHFGKVADGILRKTFYGFDDKDLSKFVQYNQDSEMLEEKRKETLSFINAGIHRLFETQLQSLREFYGRRYENILDELEKENMKHLREADGDKLKEMRDKQNAILTEAAKSSTEGFKVAAQNAVPLILRGELKNLGQMYDFDSVLDGLIRDMMHATSSSQVLEEEWASVNVDDDEGADDSSTATKRRRKRPIRWYEKLAAKALVLGVNYLQGWLAWQGIRKAAAERDKKMPKFPLF